MTTPSFAIALFLLASVACSNSEKRPPAHPSTALPGPSPVETSNRTAAPPAPAATFPAPVTAPEPSLPPPKPTTISLAKTGDSTLDAMLADADKAFEEGDLHKALAGYEAARKMAPKRAAPMVGVSRVKVTKASPSLGFAAAEKNAEVASAAKELKQATMLEPAFGPAYVERGRALLLLGDAVQAEEALRKGVRLIGDDAEAHSALGVALLATGKSEEALAELTKAKELDPGSAARRGNLGTVLFMRGRVPEAIKEYEVQVKLVPDDARAHSDLGTARLAENDFARAIPELKKAIALDPGRATFHSNLGYALQLEGKMLEAVAEYREAIRLDSKLASAWINLGTALSRDPKTRAEARQALKTAASIDPSDPRVKANLEELDALERGPNAAPNSPPPAMKK